MGDSWGNTLSLRACARIVALTAVLGTLPACAGGAADGGGDRPTTLPSVSGSSAPSPSGGSTPPTKQDRRAEVEAAVRALYDGMERAVSTGDTTQFEAASTLDCNCRDLVASVRRLFQTGGTAGVDIVELEIEVRSLAKRRASARVDYRSAPYVIQRTSGESVDVPERDANEIVDLQLLPGGWKVTQVLDLDR